MSAIRASCHLSLLFAERLLDSCRKSDVLQPPQSNRNQDAA
jgi:hypothetical protein